LIDSSQKSGNYDIKKLNILWDDGDKSTATDPKIGTEICHKYLSSGDFTAEIQIEDLHQCQDVQEINLLIKPDIAFTIKSKVIDETCDYWEIEFINDSLQFDSRVINTEWDFGDGFTEFNNFSGVKHKYNKKGFYTVKVRANLSNGCSNETTTTVNIDLPDIKYDFALDKYEQCYPLSFVLEDQVRNKKQYDWELLDTSMTLVGKFSGRITNILPTRPGKFYVRGKSTYNQCVIYSNLDSIESNGVLTRFNLLNGKQCIPLDTVYTFNTTVIHGTQDVSWKWDMQDPLSKDLFNPSNQFKNHNYSSTKDTKHRFKQDGCYTVRLAAYDNTNGCSDSTNGTAGFQKFEGIEFNFETERACLGEKNGYAIKINHNRCNINYWVKFDSACGDARNWEYFNKSSIERYYKNACSPTNDISVGIIAMAGDSIIFNSNDTSDYYITDDRFCRDTIWKHNWFKLQEDPIAEASYSRSDCIPVNASIQVKQKRQKNVSTVFAEWGDGNLDVVFVKPNEEIPPLTHAYLQEGDYAAKITVETDSGCFDTDEEAIVVGYQNSFEVDSIICTGQSITFSDSIHYFGDLNPYWKDPLREAAGLEQILWDLGDGAVTANGTSPTKTFNQEGLFEVRMYTRDENGCRDTSIKTIQVSDVKAATKGVTDRLICQGIIQLFDSSQTAFTNFGDTLSHIWDFGDSKTPSRLINPFHFYESPGTYQVKHIVTNVRGCADTAKTFIEIGGPTAKFDIVTDTVGCAPFLVELDNKSLDCSKYIWYFNDEVGNTFTTNLDDNVDFTYLKPGIYNIQLFGSDSLYDAENDINYFCGSIFPDTNNVNDPVRKVVVLPKIETSVFTDSIVCLNEEVLISSSIDTTFGIGRFIIGPDTLITSGSDTSISFKQAGNYPIYFSPYFYSESGEEYQCLSADTAMIEVKELNATLNVNQLDVCSQAELEIFAEDVQSVAWNLSYPDGDFVLGKQTITLNSADGLDQQVVCAQVVDVFGCSDVVCDTVTTTGEFSLFLPNIITPNNDGLNDYFDVEIEGETFYQLQIFNRWGQIVYSSREDFAGKEGNWQGKDQNGIPLPTGAYFYVLRFIDGCNQGKDEFSGTITLTR
jgi:gliding motility-associated-like protein